MWKELGMLAMNMRVRAANMRKKLWIVKTMKLWHTTGLVNRVRLVILNRENRLNKFYVDCKGFFWRRCMTIGITGFLNSVRRPVS
jgi:hypothetical protein